MVAGGYGVGLLVGNFTGGRWGDRFGHRSTLLVSSTISGLGVAAVPWLPVAVVATLLPVVAYLAATAGVSIGALSALAVARGDRRTSVAIVYRQLYTTVPLHLRDEGQPIAPYTAIIATGYALVGVGFALFGLPVSAVTAIVAMVVLTAGEILYKTTATAHVLDAAPDHLVGQYQGLYTGAATSGTMLAAPIGTAVYAAQPALLWPGCGVVAGVAALVVLASGRSVAHR